LLYSVILCEVLSIINWHDVFADISTAVCWMLLIVHIFSSLMHLMLTMYRLVECKGMNSY